MSEIEKILKDFGRKVAHQAVTKQVGRKTLFVPTEFVKEASQQLQMVTKQERRDEAFMAQEVADNHSMDTGAEVREVLRKRVIRLDRGIENEKIRQRN